MASQHLFSGSQTAEHLGARAASASACASLKSCAVTGGVSRIALLCVTARRAAQHCLLSV